MTQLRVLFAVDAGPQAGMGHLVRSVALAQALSASGVACVFPAGGHPSVAEKIRASGAHLVAVGDDGLALDTDPRRLAGLAQENRCTAILIDSYRVGERTRAGLRELGFAVAVIDDLARERFSCHLVINGGAQAAALQYESSASDTIFLLGPRYTLLRSEFWNPPTARESRASVRHVLVSLGGGASAGLIADVLKGIDAVDHDFEVTVIQGPFTTDHDSQNPLRAGRHPVRVIADPPSVSQTMRDADLAICGGGQTLLELSAAGTPAIALQLADNQAGNLAAVVRSGAAHFAGIGRAPGAFHSISAMVQELCERTDLRAAMSVAGPRLVDGEGAVRVAQVLLELLAAHAKIGRVPA